MRALALAVTTILACMALPAAAIGLGPIEVDSHLNEPFSGSIPITGADASLNDAIVVSLASPERFERTGLTRPFALALLKFSVYQTDAGPRRIDIRSSQPIKEPALDFLLEVDTPEGTLIQRYTVLLDPPAGIRKARPATPPAPAPSPDSDPTPLEDAAPTTPPTAAPDASQPNDAAGADPMTATGDSYGPTGPTDTLWSIANKLRPDDSVTVYQVMHALMRRNPDAFTSGSGIKLRSGVTLAIPTVAEMTDTPAADARTLVREHFGS